MYKLLTICTILLYNNYLNVRTLANMNKYSYYSKIKIDSHQIHPNSTAGLICFLFVPIKYLNGNSKIYSVFYLLFFVTLQRNTIFGKRFLEMKCDCCLFTVYFLENVFSALPIIIYR